MNRDAQPGAPLDPYHAAYLLRRTLETDPERVPMDIEEAHRVFEALAEEDALTLVGAAEAAIRFENIRRLGAGLAGRDTRPAVRAAWLMALTKSASPEARAAVRTALAQDPSPRVLATALRAWDSLSEGAPLEFLRPFLTHADARVRANAAELLIERDAPGTERVLEVLLNDPAPRVAAAAALALWRRGHRHLTRYLSREEVPAARLAYLHACSRAGRDRRLRELVREAMHQGSADERRIGARALAAVSPPDEVSKLVEEALRSEDHQLRRALLAGCFEEDAATSRVSLEAALRVDPAPGRHRFRANALGALREVGGVPDLALVTPLISDVDPRVRANAIELATEQGDGSRLRPALVRALEDEAPRVRANAAVALWHQGAPTAMARLVREVEANPDRAASASAAWALGKMGGAVAERALETALRDGRGATRRMAYRVLAKAA